MANRRRRSSTRVSAGARQGAKKQQKDLMKYGLGALAAVAVIVVVVIAVASSSGSSGEGEQAQDFDFSLFQGIDEIGFRDGNLARLHCQGKPLVLTFWAGLCPPCPAELPPLPAFLDVFKAVLPLL